MTLEQTSKLPLGLLAELTHRCPLSCPYCSNPINLLQKNSELDTETWKQVFTQAAKLGVLQIHLSGGEPLIRSDIVTLTKHAKDVGLYTNLITSGITGKENIVSELKEVGLDHVQLSFQGASAEVANYHAHYEYSHQRKINFAHNIIQADFPLTVNAVIHRGNIQSVGDMIDMAVLLKASRVEIAHVQYYGWALKNRAALIPSLDDITSATKIVRNKAQQYSGLIVIDMVLPDYYAKYPKACMGGWGTRSLNVMPNGKVLPCHAAQCIEELEFWSITERALEDIWNHSPAFNAFRGETWMKEPCRSCDRRHIDFGGCRCQAYAFTGNARNTDPACSKSSHHIEMGNLATREAKSNCNPMFRTYTMTPTKTKAI